jgi:hypothetical protein
LIAAGAMAGGSAGAEFSPIPLAPVANRELTDEAAGDDRGGWTDQGKENCLTGFPRGSQRFKGIPFDIVEKGPAALMFGSKHLSTLPTTAELTLAPVKAEMLYLLATYAWGGEGTVAAIDVHYEDGEKQTLALTWGERIGGWWNPKDLEQATVAWKGQNGLGVDIGVYLIPFRLSRPHKAVKALTMTATHEGGSLAVLGITFGEVPAEKLVQGPQTWQSVQTNMDGWFPIRLPYDRDTVAAWEKGFLPMKPAGAHGWLRADQERLVFEDGTPIRFKGAVLCGPAIYPPKSAARHFVRRLKKFGVNQVRFHSLMDAFLDDGKDTRKINETRLDKFDLFVSELKKAGIYVKVSMLFSHRWGPETGVILADKIQPLNNTQYTFDRRHQELYLEFLRKFFAHRNPYTGLTYAEDPVFCMFKVVNESSLFFNTDGLPGPYRVKLQELWNAWLKKKYGSDARLFDAWQVPGEGPPVHAQTEKLTAETVALRGVNDLANIRPAEVKRARDQTQFYYELERDWFAKVRDAVRATGSRALVQGSSWGGPGYLQEIQTAVNANFDFVGKHSYWLHPHVQGGWGPTQVTFDNLPITKFPRDNFFNFIYQQPAGKPFTCTEWTFPLPNDYNAEAAPFMAAYGALQGLAANHRFVVGDVDAPGFLNTTFGMFENPGQMAAEPLAYFLYVRGDVQQAPVIYRNALDATALHDPLRKRKMKTVESDTRFAMKFGGLACPADTAFIGRVETSFDPRKYPAIWDQKTYQKCHDQEARTITSVTGELIWNYDQGWIRVNTPKTQGVLGFLNNQTFKAGGLTMTLNDAYAVVHFTSLDNQPLTKSRSILVSLIGRTRNTGQLFGKRGDVYRYEKQGDAPILMEPVTADFTLKTSAKNWRVTPLTFNGDALPDQTTALKAEQGAVKGRLSNKTAGAVHFLLEAAG